MARQKKSLKQRLLSLLLFLSITWVVFNIGFLIHHGSVLLGIKELDFHEVSKINLGFDDELNNRPFIMAHNNHVVVSFSNELTIYNKDGKSIIKKEINNDDTEIIGLTDYFVIVEKTQGHLYFFDYKGNETGVIESMGPIRDLIEAANNMLAVITKENDLKIFRYDETLMGSFSLSSGEVLGLDLSADGSEILVNMLNSDENKFVSNLLTYDMADNSIVGGKNEENRIVYGAKIVNDLVVIVDNFGQMAREVDSTDGELWVEERDGLLTHFKIDNNGNIFEILALENIENLVGITAYQIVGRNQDGKMLFKNELEHKYDKIALQGGLVMIQSNQDVLILDSSGELLMTFDSPRKIISSQWLSNSRVLIEYNDYFSIYELKY